MHGTTQIAGMFTCVIQKYGRPKKQVDFSSFRAFQSSSRELQPNPPTPTTTQSKRSITVEGISSKYCKLTVSFNNGQLSSILLKLQSSLYSNPFENTLTNQESARVMTMTLVKLGVVERHSEVRQHLTFSGDYLYGKKSKFKIYLSQGWAIYRYYTVTVICIILDL